MQFVDIHTHHRPLLPELAIWNCDFSDLSTLTPHDYISLGLHPWHLQADSMTSQISQLEQAVLHCPNLVAIGETGLDKLCSTDWQLQATAFKAQIALATKYSLPLLVHCVKAHQEVMALKRESKSNIPWVIHGFRGKKELAQQYVHAGFYLSFGFKYQPEALLYTPHERLFLETDDCENPILELYVEVARQMGITTEKLSLQIRQNADKVFFNR